MARLDLAAPAVIVRTFAQRLEAALPLHVRLELGTLDPTGVTRVDASALERMLAQLSKEAIDAMPDGGKILFECRNTFLEATHLDSHGWLTLGAHVCLTVTDTRNRAPNAATHGVAAVYRFMEEHQGMAHVSAGPRETSVRLYFPIVEGS